MSLDLDSVLGGWPYEPGQLKVRKILGDDGQEKVQLRLDLGVIQMETKGRPDGQTPHGYESLFEFHQQRQARAQRLEEPFKLTVEQISELQAEGIQYYHRYISLFQLQDFLGVVRDTQRNLDLFAFVETHAPDAESGWTLKQFTPYVRMMNTRAKACIALAREEYHEAMALVEKGMQRIQEFYESLDSADMLEESPELEFLGKWMEEIKAKRPLTKLQRIQRDLDEAVAAEHYERAAELRDMLKNMGYLM